MPPMPHRCFSFRRLASVAVLLVTITGVACRDQAAEKREIDAAAGAAAQKAVAEERARVAKEEADKAAAIENEKKRVIAEPSNYLEATELNVLNNGIVRPYREVG